MSERVILNKNQAQIDGILDGSQKLLQILTTESRPSSEFNEFITPLPNMVIGSDGRFAYTNHLLNPYEREHWWIPMDHCYARPWNWRPESTFLRPTKTLFMPKVPSSRKKTTNPLAPIQECDDVVDVVTDSEEPTPIYDKVKAKHLMEECEKHAAMARVDEGNDDWEESVSRLVRLNWTTTQNRLFNGVVSILNADHLARLAHSNSHNEAIARRVTIDKSVERMRRLMATVSWDPKYTQWLHQILIDHLNTSYLAAYLDILQTLRSKLPTFVDKMMGAANSSKLSILSYETLFPLLKRPWDPVALSLMQDKPKKLPGNPVIVVVPSTPISSKRMLKWISLLSNLATVITVPANYGGGLHKTTMMNCVDQMFVITRNKIQDIRLDYPGRSIVLAGFGFGATLALQLAQVEQVLCVISIGFSLLTADGKRGEPDDNLLELQCPVLFVIGQCSNTSLQEDMEDLRERMRVETGLIVVGNADDNLRVSKKKRKSEGITQSIVDRCVADEIGEFISGVILSPYPPQLRQSPTNLTTEGLVSKKLKSERKRYNSNTSSIDSEPPSPTPRISRPGQNNSHLGRPPGSKSKAKMEAKWAAQAKAMGLQNRSLSGLLQGDVSSLMQSKSNSSGIRVLENVKITGGLNPKFFSNNGKMIDMSKVSVINPKSNNVNSLVLLPDGKIKSFAPNIKIPGGRYITSKRQLLGNRPPKSVKKVSYISQPMQTNLSPPTNLTSQDIMNLPIIFADDNQILDNTLTQTVPSSPNSKILSANSGSKFMLINNKPSNFIISPNPKSTNVTQPAKVTPKYTKIILSSKRTTEQTPTTSSVVKKITNLPSEISVRKVNPSETSTASQSEELDLENEIVASTLFKRKVEDTDAEGLEIVSNKPEEAQMSTEGESLKRTANEANIDNEDESTPSKVSKVETA
ncbi:KAT8 regulatory NSL complex subunit 3 isoform X3 [Tribolium madens]|uniref:KAT8 regulatory NSL complex subunit 3 isoform X3 n=1 Tax=Tribolium madens TaxID=41895 RepID=UPI001CF7550A|nr:KAT8 regulatory NSL complex subunit 3 isoform X3 [Tribolium madens]